MSRQPASVLWFETLSRGDVALVGGRNSSLGEMVPQLGRKGVQVSCGFAASADACRAFLAANALPSRIADRLQRWRNHKLTLHKAGIQRRAMILAGDRPKDIKADIRKAYRALSQRAKTTGDVPLTGAGMQMQQQQQRRGFFGFNKSKDSQPSDIIEEEEPMYCGPLFVGKRKLAVWPYDDYHLVQKLYYEKLDDSATVETKEESSFH